MPGSQRCQHREPKHAVQDQPRGPFPLGFGTELQRFRRPWKSHDAGREQPLRPNDEAGEAVRARGEVRPKAQA